MADTSRSTGSPWKSVVGDALLLAAILCFSNVTVAREDPGFFSMNPSPWILLPLILGARHGPGSGILGSLLAAGLVIAGFYGLKAERDIGALVTDRAYFFVAVLAAGAIGGLVHTLLAGPAKAARIAAQDLAVSNRQLQSERDLSRASEDQLVRRLLLNDADIISLQDRAARLFANAPDAREVETRLLGLLDDLFEVHQAAIYRLRYGNSWERSSSIGDVSSFPEKTDFSREASPLAGAAIDSEEIATIASLWCDHVSPADTGKNLAALPFKSSPGSDVDTLLIIRYLPASAATWENLTRIEALFRWVLSTVATPKKSANSSALSGAPDSPTIHPPEQFSLCIDQAVAAAASLPLDFRLLLFEPSNDASAASQKAFIDSIQQHARSGDSIGGVQLGLNDTEAFAIGLLSPLSTDEAAANRATEILRPVPGGEDSVCYRSLTIDRDSERFNREWNTLVKADSSSADNTAT